MQANLKPTEEMEPLNPIRVETALSRYPVHRLAKQGTIAIDIRESNEAGEVQIRWEVDHSGKLGQPGPLAYKIDTLIINRRIEEAPRPVPRIIKLGSLRDVCRELELNEGQATRNVKKALYQNASAFITAKMKYRLASGAMRTLEAGFTRYSVVLTGEELPDGRKADAVYIVLNDVFMQVINGAITRPLDYDYLKELNPAAQRFYELFSYKMYAALKYDKHRAELVYSEFCRYAPQTRYLKFEQVKKQMYKIHAVHRKSGYIGKVEYQQTVSVDEKPDWIICYQPGPKAHAEFHAFNKRGGPTVLEVEPTPSAPTALPLIDQPNTSPLTAELIARGVSPGMAGDLVEAHDAELIRAQMDQIDWRLEHGRGKIADPAAWLVKGLRRGGYAPPKGYKPKAERERQAEETRQRMQKTAETQRQTRTQEQREREEKAMILDYWERLSLEQREALQAEADAMPGAQPIPGDGPLKRMGQGLNRHALIRKFLEAEGRLPLPE